MENYKDFFEQTSKTILFEKFAESDVNGDPVPCLRRYLSEDDVTSDRFFKKVVAGDKGSDSIGLGVRSFEEFLDKFTPWVYEMIGPGKDEDSVEIRYSFDKPDHYDDTGLEPTALNATAIYEMVNKLYEQRKDSGRTQLDFDFSDVAKMLSPESQTAKLKQARGDMEFYIQQYYKLEEKTPGVQSPEKKNCIKRFNVSRLAVTDYYTKGSAKMLELKLGDAATALLETKKSGGSGSAGGRIGIPFYDEEGELRFKELEYENENEIPKLEGSPTQKMLQILTDDYKNTAPRSMQESPEITNLVLSNITTELARTRHDEKFWLKRLESGQRDYKKWMENLAETVAPLIEKFMGVKAFFENAAAEDELDTMLIVANSTVSELVETDTVKKNLAKFLKLVNRKRQEKIWFGILPGIALGNEVAAKKSEKAEGSLSDDPFGSIFDIQEEEEEKVRGLVSAEDAKMLLDICEEAHIMAFYNYKANKNTCFGNINKPVYEMMKNRLNFENGAYAVCCLPNFTIIPEEETTVIINRELVEKKCQENYVALQIPSIYVDAAYVAAGMMVGTQQNRLLTKKGFEVDRKLTNIRVDLEDKRIYKKYQSNMCIENLLPCPKDMDEDIMEARFGFYFSDSEITGENGRPIKHCYVRNARTMKKNGERYTEITNQLFEDFIEAIILDGQESVEPGKVQDFLNDDVQKWSDYAQTAEQNQNKPGETPYINALLKSGETITSSDNKTIDINYVHAKGFVRPKIKSN